ncbi:MAG: hypothetical protein ACREOH_01465 [Candidatus Entotheonellia bacterium]
MVFVSDIRRAGIELDVQNFIWELKRQARRDLPKRASKAAINAKVAKRVATGVDLPEDVVASPRPFGGVVYYWRCQGCGRRRRFLYRWPREETWLCRGCLALRYTSQAWPRLSPLHRVFATNHELDDLDRRIHALGGRVGRPPARTRQRLKAQRNRWSERLGDALEHAACLVNLGTGGWA